MLRSVVPVVARGVLRNAAPTAPAVCWLISPNFLSFSAVPFASIEIVSVSHDRSSVLIESQEPIHLRSASLLCAWPKSADVPEHIFPETGALVLHRIERLEDAPESP